MATTPTPVPTVGEKILTDIEKVFLGIIQAGTVIGPVFIHSTHGIAVLNAGETLLASVLQQFAPKA